MSIFHVFFFERVAVFTSCCLGTRNTVETL